MQAGLPLLVVGMGTVFSFLILMVLSMSLMERLLRPWADTPDEEADAAEGERIAVAILAAAAGDTTGERT